MAAFFSRANARSKGEESTFVRVTDDRDEIIFHFCPVCGSNVYWEPSWKPDTIGVAVGAFGDRNFPRPDQSVWDAERFEWLTLAEEITRRAGS